MVTFLLDPSFRAREMPTYGLHAASPHPERSFRARQMVTFFLDPSFRAREMPTYGLHAASLLLSGRFVHAKWQFCCWTHRFVNGKCLLMVSMHPFVCQRFAWRCDASAEQVLRNSAQAAVLVHVCRFRPPRGTHLSNHDPLRLWAVCRFIACLCF